MSRRVEDNPPLDVTLRDYGARPSVASYVLNSPDEIQGDLFSFVSTHPNVTMSQVSKLAQEMMLSYHAMASSKGLPRPEADVYYRFEDGWFIKVLETVEEIENFNEVFTGSISDSLGIFGHTRKGGMVFALMDNIGASVAYIKVEPVSNTGRYNVFEIVPRNVEVIHHLFAFFADEEHKFKLPISWSMWATESNGQQFHFDGLCEGVGDGRQFARAIGQYVYGRDRFNLFRNIISVPVSHLMERVLHCLIQKLTPGIADRYKDLSDVALMLASIYVDHDKRRARQWTVAEAKKKNQTPFGGENEILGGEIALPFYLMEEYNRSAYSWLIRHRRVIFQDIYDLPEFLKFASHYGSKPDPKYYKNDDDGYAAALDAWADAKAEARANWVEADNSISVSLFDLTIDYYHETVQNYVNYKNVLDYMANDWKHHVIYERG